jgi:chemotaxis protein MotB
MKVTKPVIIVPAVALVAVIGYAFYLRQGPLKNIYIDNLGLSVARSTAVARTLRKMGVNPQILSAAGYSMHRPATANAAPDGQQQNRRVEIILAPLHGSPGRRN